MNKYVNLVVFIDGTGNEISDTPRSQWTNIARLYDACRECFGEGDVAEQRVFYRKGVGTRSGESFRGGLFGRYLQDRVKEARTWLDLEIGLAVDAGWTPRIYLFGFSRGAYAVRVLADQINVRVELMGVWDTVKATITGPDVGKAGDNVKRICHAMAIDEHRKLFDVVRFEDTPQATEVWFPGCHADVGGGYEEMDLALASLNWVARIAEDSGLIVDARRIPVERKFYHMPVMHDESRKFKWRMIGCLTGDGLITRTVKPGDLIYRTVRELETTGEYDSGIGSGHEVIG